MVVLVGILSKHTSADYMGQEADSSWETMHVLGMSLFDNRKEANAATQDKITRGPF